MMKTYSKQWIPLFPGSSDVLYGVRYSKKEGMFKGSLADEDEMEETLEFAKKIAGKTLRALCADG